MSTSRRDFLKTTAAVGGALTLGLGSYACRPRRLNILILGGTSFTGPHLIRYALERGHSVSIFTRGRTQPTIFTELYEQVEHLVGDRNDDHEALEGRTWDAVIDNSGRYVEWTTTSAQLLRDAADVYMYTSSTGVYLPYFGMDITEDTEVLLEDLPEVQENRRPTYGVMKSLSEIEARNAFGEDRTIVVRPTYIVGPGDSSNRWQYWPIRIRRGGEVFVPGKEDDPVQYIDVRDLTEFMIRLLENRTTGTFNAAGPASPQGMHEFVHGVHDAIGSDVEWIMGTDHDFLREHNLQFNIPWIMPVEDYVGSARINIERAKAAGLTFRPLAQTTMDTLAWWDSDAVPEERRGTAFNHPRGFNPQREAEVIAAWKAREG